MQTNSALLPEIFCVQRVVHETADTVTLWLEAPNGGEIPTFKPGQFNMLYAFGVGEIPISICSQSADRTFGHSIRAVGAVSRALTQLQAGDHIGLRGPFGSAWPIERIDHHDVLIIAGGIGLAPLRGLVEQVISSSIAPEKMHLVYGARDPANLLYAQECAAWAQDLDLHITVDFAEQDWKGSIGVVTDIIPYSDLNPTECMTFMCGPEVMIYYSVQSLIDNGHQPENIFVSMERNMQCAVGTCGHCQFGNEFVCRDGPVFSWQRIGRLFGIREL